MNQRFQTIRVAWASYGWWEYNRMIKKTFFMRVNKCARGLWAFFSLTLFTLFLTSVSVAQVDNVTSFDEYYDQVFQIRVISPKAGSKSSIGSGFVVSADGVLMTNYHVVSSFVQSPELNRIEYQSHTGQKGDLTLLDFDVIHDLAILKIDKPGLEVMRLSDTPLRKGETVYALGNPRDYGTSLVKGPNNGLVEHSYNDQVLFSGSLNPGMSGGPALNAAGDVVGVNVATAGSQLSFLVPAKKARALLQRKRVIEKDNYQEEIAQQIKQWQRPRLQELIDMPWINEKFADKDLFGEIRKDFQCWGGTNEENKERHVANVSKTCRAGDSLYLDSNLDAGELYFSFSQSTSLNLTSSQFTRMVQPWMSANNRSNYENSTNYKCHADFVEGNTGDSSFTRVTTCIRAFKKLTGLFDSLLLVERVSNNQEMSTHLSISAIEKDQIQAMNRKFLERSL